MPWYPEGLRLPLRTANRGSFPAPSVDQSINQPIKIQHATHAKELIKATIYINIANQTILTGFAHI